MYHRFIILIITFIHSSSLPRHNILLPAKRQGDIVQYHQQNRHWPRSYHPRYNLWYHTFLWIPNLSICLPSGLRSADVTVPSLSPRSSNIFNGENSVLSGGVIVVVGGHTPNRRLDVGRTSPLGLSWHDFLCERDFRIPLHVLHWCSTKLKR